MPRSDYTFDGKKLDANVRDAILSIRHSASMKNVAQLTIQLADTLDFDYLSKGLFDAGVLITSSNLAATYEIAAVEVRDNPAPQSVAISARSKPAQFFKKTKTAMVKSGVSPSDFLRSEAASQGGSVVAQDSPKRTTSVNNENQQESTWDVMKKIAGELKYEFWEYKGVFYFGKEDFWLDKPVKWTMSYDKGKPVPEDNTFNIDDATYITTFGVPNCRRSEDAKDVTMTVSLSVEREQAEKLAPGDPVYFYGVPTWENKYLITSMESDLLEPASVVSVQLGTIIKKKKKKSQASGGSGGTSYEEVFPAPCQYNLGAGTRFSSENGTVPAYPWSSDGRWVLGKEAGDYSQCSRSADIDSAYKSWESTIANSRADVEGI